MSALLALFGRAGLQYEIVVMLAVAYAMWKISPTRLFTGTRVWLDDSFLIVGMILLQQRLFVGVGEMVSTITGGLILTAFAVVAATLPTSKASMLGRYKSVGRKFIPSLVLTWALYALVYKALVHWGWSSPLLTILLAAFALSPSVRKAPVHLFHSKRGFLLGLSGLLVVHAVVSSALALSTVGVHASPQWIFGIAGFLCLLAMPAYMWHKTFKVRSSHRHVPDWKPWQTALVSGLLVFPLFWPVARLAPGSNAIAVAAVLPSMSWLPFAVAAGVFLTFLVFGLYDTYIGKLLMVGPFLAGAYILGVYAYYAFITEFSIVVTMRSTLWSLPIHAMVFLVLGFFLVLGYFSFLYELWRD